MGESGQGRFQPLVERLDAALRAGKTDGVTARVKTALEQVIGAGALRLPDPFRRAGAECYARRLLHRAPELGYTVVVMAWGPGQRTELHDHAGMWCVECVLEGEIDVTQYDLVERDGARYRFRPHTTVRAGVGQAGCLIPPFEYHVLANAVPDRTSISLHVYENEMDHCSLFRPAESGWWSREGRTLSYDN